MTDVGRDDAFDRDLRLFLAEHARDVAGVPTAREAAARLAASVVPKDAVHTRVPSRFAWAAAAALLAAALLGALLVGTGTQRPGAISYDAVFLRTENETATTGDVVVIAIDANGRERELLRLPARGLTVPGTELAVLSDATLSATGILAVRRGEPLYRYHFELIDLHRPNAPAVVLDGIGTDYDTRGAPAWWGPGDQLAISWYAHPEQPSDRHLSFVDGRTGAVTTLARPVVFESEPYWTADARGLVLRNSAAGMEILLRDGSTTIGTAGIFDDGRRRRYAVGGALLTVDGQVVTRVSESGVRTPLFDATRTPDDFAWAAGGTGVWLLTSAPVGGALLLERQSLDGALAETIRLDDPAPIIGATPRGSIVGLAPDDVMLVVSIAREVPTGEGATTTGLGERLVVTVPGRQLEVEGRFAGWLAVGE